MWKVLGLLFLVFIAIAMVVDWVKAMACGLKVAERNRRLLAEINAKVREGVSAEWLAQKWLERDVFLNDGLSRRERLEEFNRTDLRNPHWVFPRGWSFEIAAIEQARKLTDMRISLGIGVEAYLYMFWLLQDRIAASGNRCQAGCGEPSSGASLPGTISDRTYLVKFRCEKCLRWWTERVGFGAVLMRPPR